jgi:hypothetical protein
MVSRHLPQILERVLVVAQEQQAACMLNYRAFLDALQYQPFFTFLNLLMLPVITP